MEKKKLLYINIDGFSYSYWERLRREGRSGGFETLLKDGMLFTQLRSGLVSITNPMQSAILCGAWSEKTHNFYQHYDRETGSVVKHKRTFDAENAAEVFLRHGRSAVSIHQFMLENNPCVEGEWGRTYFKCAQDPSNYRQRLELLKRIAAGLPVASGGRELTYPEFPDFTALYIDDIDSLGHNNDYEAWPRRSAFEARQQDILQRLTEIQAGLADFAALCRARGLWEELVVLITTDHGMTPFFGQSRLRELVERLNRAGIAAAVPKERRADTQVVVLPYTIQASLYCVKPLAPAQMELIARVCGAPDYVQRVFGREEMRRDYGLDDRGPDFLVSPRRGFHFYHRDIPEDTFGAGHDSYDDTSQHIFGMLLGGGVPKGVEYGGAVSAVDLMPTILKERFGYAMRDSTGRIFSDWFLPQEGPLEGKSTTGREVSNP